MTRVDFYVLPNADPAQRPLLACKLAEKAYGQGLKVYIHTASASDTQQLDELLWTFRDGSFLPHAIHSAVNGEPPPILLGHDHEPTGHTDVLINLGTDIPTFLRPLRTRCRTCRSAHGIADAIARTFPLLPRTRL